jgi:hypothetical protein
MESVGILWSFGILGVYFLFFRSFSIFVVIFIDFSPFWYFVPRKIWQPFETSYVYVERMYLHTFIQMSLLHSQTLKAAKGFDSFLIFWIIRFHFSAMLNFFLVLHFKSWRSISKQKQVFHFKSTKMDFSPF